MIVDTNFQTNNCYGQENENKSSQTNFHKAQLLQLKFIHLFARAF